MASKKLDRSRDYGTIVGDEQGRVYEQDGAFFTSDGNEWAEPGRRRTPAPAAPPAPKPAEPTAADEQIARQLTGA